MPSPINTPAGMPIPTAASIGLAFRTQEAARPSGGPASTAASPQKAMTLFELSNPRNSCAA